MAPFISMSFLLHNPLEILGKMVGVQVHRCRFVEWVPSTVTALAIDDAGEWLAVGREDGEIRVYRLPPPLSCSYVIRSIFAANFWD